MSQTIPGFALLGERELSEYRAIARHFRHAATGCEVLHLASADRENLFGFCFATPPVDDSGLPHVLEHAVLSGSRRYPLKEPFTVLAKGSVQTYLNAGTGADTTYYPAASCVAKDFFHLLDVYGDAVFYPLLREETFAQEAWRIEGIEGPDAPRITGVVYNEMKGAAATAERIAGEWAIRGLFADTAYGRTAGGDPRSISQLTCKRLREYHATWYHPSNCRLFLSGSIPPEESLGFIRERFLAGFGPARIDARIPDPAPWEAPRRLERTFALPPGTPVERRSTVLVSWLGPRIADQAGLLVLEVLADVLVGTPGSPLWKALAESGLGEDIAPATGLQSDLDRAVFSAGLRGTEAGRTEEVEGLVMRTLGSLARDGLPPILAESAINRLEFRNREIRGGGVPYALRLLDRCLRGWAHGADPIDSLAFTPLVTGLRGRMGREPRLLEGILEPLLLANPHRLTLLVRPDPDQEARERAEEQERLAAMLAAMGAEGRRRSAAAEAAFQAFQSRQETAAEQSIVPFLSRSDLAAEPEAIPSEEDRLPDGTRLLVHGLFTNGIAYLDLGLPVDGLEPEESLLVPLLGRAITGSGLPGIGYAEVALSLQRLTGGFSAVLDVGGIAGSPGAVGRYLILRMKALERSLPEAVDLVARLAFSADFRDRSRLRDIVLEFSNDLKAGLLPAGHRVASLRAGGHVSAAVAVEEGWRGLTQLEFITGLAHSIEGRLDGLIDSLERLRAKVMVRGGAVVNLTTAPASVAAVRPLVGRLSAGLAGSGGGSFPPRAAPPPDGIPAESLVTSTPVGYGSRAIAGLAFEDPRSPHLAVLGHLLATGPLWEVIRREGGAYGAVAYPRPLDGLFILGSYRDPRVGRTLGVFREAVERVARGEETEVERAVVGTIGAEDRPLDPGEQGLLSLQRALHGVTDALRAERRGRILSCAGEQLRAAAEGLLAVWDRGCSVVLAGRELAEEAARDVPELAARVREVPA